jgi:hypothetical protein
MIFILTQRRVRLQLLAYWLWAIAISLCAQKSLYGTFEFQNNLSSHVVVGGACSNQSKMLWVYLRQMQQKRGHSPLCNFHWICCFKIGIFKEDIHMCQLSRLFLLNSILAISFQSYGKIQDPTMLQSTTPPIGNNDLGC